MEAASAQEIFSAASEIADREERQAMLERACAGDLQLRAHVEELLEAASGAERFFTDCFTAVSTKAGSGELKAVQEAESAQQIQETLGSTIGPYKVLDVIGEGGCGIVYTAEQETPVQRRVAMKIIKLGMDTKSVIARFNAEQQALAMMDHPNIARVLDAGATDKGRPYFVMELVRGVKLTIYCDEQQLDIRQRLNLFILVCHAVQHAHQKGIIHRDLKPSNILVTMMDGVPVPKVIDFGIAKAISGRLADHSTFTSFHQFIGTPDYMSPEQAQLSTLDVDTRSDIYSLGVLLYELLTGRTPFNAKELLQSGLEELQHALREREPMRPSGIMATLPAGELNRVAHCRRADPAKLGSMFHSDLDWIVIKALEKDRSRRYQTANGLALDVQRYLNNEPVWARAPSRIYRLQKLVRRNKTVFTAAGAVVLILMASSAVATWLLLTAREAQKRAATAEQEKTHVQKEADQMRRTVENDQKLFEVGALIREGELPKADKLLDQMRISKPDHRFITMYQTLGDWAVDQGDWQKAVKRFRVLFRINETEHVDNNMDYLRNDTRYGVALVEQGDLKEYDRFRKELTARIPNPANSDVAQEVLRDCLLTPADPAMIQALKKDADVIEASLDQSSSQLPPGMMAAFYCYSMALYAYRSGDYPVAITWCDRAGSFDHGIESRDAGIQLIKAMSLKKTGNIKTARTLFEASRSTIENNFPFSQRTRQWNGFWFDQTCARILLREAKTTFGSAGQPLQ